METICGIIGFIIGIVLFVLLMDRMHFLFVNFSTILFIFIACVVVGCTLAYIFGWIFLILLGCAVIYLLFFKESSKGENQSENDTEEIKEEKSE